MDGKKRIETLSDIITGIARRSQYKFRDMECDDLIQELWIAVLEMEKKLGKPADLNLVASCCYRQIVDLQRHSIHTSSIDIEDVDDVADVLEDYSDEFAYVEDHMIIEQILRDLPENSLEGIYVRCMMSKEGIIDYDYEPTGKYNNGYTEASLAKFLGFSSAEHRGYKRVRNNVRTYLLQFKN